MKVFDFQIRVPVGIHARNALILSQTTAQYMSNIMLHKGELAVNAKNLMDVMVLWIKYNDIIRFVIEGLDEEEAYAGIVDLCHKNL